ncbi:ELMO/CED-12 family-domain-containing protein [Globomyces pollinis-pini]|nr:ELMO/CED-12 family-domain-containing protein [Globomyces pollinis-pini]
MDKTEVAIINGKKIKIDPETLFRLDQCILYSSKLEEFRRPFESWFAQFDLDPNEQLEPGTGVKFEELYHLLLKLKKFPQVPNEISPQAIVLRAGLTQVFSTFQLLHELNKRAASRYDITVPANEKKLYDIWKFLMPDESLQSRFTTQWQKIGFQGKDPSTDFRAMGLLALDNLYYFCDTYIEIARRILSSSHHPISWFSFAIVGINITAYLLRLVRTRQLQWTFYVYGTHKDIFNEIYCYIFDGFEKHWSSQSKPPSILDFNSHFKAFTFNFEIWLLQRQNVFLKPRQPLIKE